MPQENPNHAPACASRRSAPEIERCIARGIQERIFSAASVVGSVQGALFHCTAQGTLQAPPPTTRADVNTFFDLGNLTMPLATAVAAMVLVARHRLELGASVATILPEFNHPPFTQMTLDMLLDHSSGLPANLDLLQPLMAADAQLHPQERLLGSRRAVPELQAALAQTPLQAPPGSVVAVSDVGFMLLGWCIEKVVGKPLDLYLQQEIYGPLGLADELFFVRLDAPRNAKRTFAATEKCPWRQKLLQGEVHEKHAWAVGGVAGQAGLFGSAAAVWRLCQRLLDCAHGRHGFFHTGTLTRFWTRSRRVQTTRTLGWDTPTVLGSSAGKRLARTAVGHVSALGPMVWIDRTHEMIGVLTSNGAHPSLDDKQVPMGKLNARAFELLAANAALGPPPPDSDASWQNLLDAAKR